MCDEAYIKVVERRLNSHITEFERHIAEEEKRWENLIASQEENTASIKELIACTHELHASTKGVVDAWNTGVNAGKFVRWLSGFAVLAGLGAWFSDHLNW